MADFFGVKGIVHRFFFSLRFRLTLLILFVIVPAFGITHYLGLEQRKILVEKAKREALILLHNSSERHKQYIEGGHQLLRILSQLPQVRNRDFRGCTRLFSDLLRENPHYLNIGILGEDGYLWTSGLPYEKPIYAGDRPYFQRAIQTQNFTMGEYQIGRVTGKPGINLAYPIVDRGKVRGIIYVVLDLTWLGGLAEGSELPGGSVVTLVDSRGVILARFPEGEKWVGKSLSKDAFSIDFFSGEEGTFEKVGMDGIKRLYAFTSLRSHENRFDKIFLSVGIPSEAIFFEVDKALKRSLLFLSLFGIFSLLTIGIGGNLFLFRNLNPILDAARRLGAGDFGARTHLRYGRGELGQLALTFDQMANSLERREEERRVSERKLHESEERYRELANLLPEIVFETDEKGNLTFANKQALEVFGYREEDLLQGLKVFDRVVPEEFERSKEAFLKVLSSEKWRDEFRLRRRDGNIFPAIVQAAPILRGGKVVGVRGMVVDISERKRKEEELREAFAELSAIYRNVPVLMVLLDQERRVRKVNDAMVGFTGRSFEEIETLLWGEALRCIHSLDDPGGCGYGPYCQNCTIRLVLLDSIENNKSYFGVEARLSLMIRESEEERWFVLNTNPVMIGEKVNILVTLQDVTSLKMALEELQENMEALRAFINANPETSLLLDEKGTILIANETLSKRLGKRMEDLVGSCLYDLLPEDLARERKANIGKVFSTGNPFRFEDEREGRAYETFVYPIFDREGKVTRVTVLGIDITERRHMQEDLQRKEERFRELFNDAPVGYHEYDMEGRIREVNQTELEMLGYSREEMVGHWVWEFVGEEISRETVKAKLSGALPTGIPFERTYKKKDGTLLPVLITDRVLRDSEGGIIGIRSAHQDISRLKEVEKERESLQEQLQQAQKMEAIGRLTGGVAHDFNNLLTVIRGYSQLSLLGLNEDNPLRGALEEIERASERASNLTRQLLAFSRRQVFETRVLDLNFILKDLKKMLRRVIGEDIELVTILSDDLGKVKTDPGQIEQVILNLVVNAMDAMPEGGRLTIETANVVLDEEYARRHIAVTPGPYVMLSVSDTGCGMTLEVKEKIFEPFFTTKGKGKGTGLGLSTVYGIVKQSGGSIWVYSEPGRGTTFKIYLPRVEEEDEFRGRPVEKEIPRGSETILVIEDDDSVRKLAIRFLETQGYLPLEAKQGEEALEIFQNYQGPIHLILIDVIMPGGSGPQVIERLKETSREFKVLFMSGYTDNTIVHHGVLKKGVEFIQKPFTLEALSRKVREVLDK